MSSHKCAACGLKVHVTGSDGICGVFGHPIHLDDDSCSKFNENPHICAICHKVIIENEIIELYGDGSIKAIMCRDCNSTSGTCVMCANRGRCAFKDDPSPLPQFIEKTIQTAQGTFVGKILNLERITITCKKCLCYNDEGFCNKESSHTCGNYKSSL